MYSVTYKLMSNPVLSMMSTINVAAEPNEGDEVYNDEEDTDEDENEEVEEEDEE